MFSSDYSAGNTFTWTASRFRCIIVFAIMSLVAAIFTCFPVGYEINTHILGNNETPLFSFENFMVGGVVVLTFWCALVSAVAGCCRS